VKHGNYFVGSVPLDTDQISVEGHLRTGRSVEAKRSLVELVKYARLTHSQMSVRFIIRRARRVS
jgi:hypothetical protein